ncbi:MAG: substrate-binding domain-containing protein [Bacteroidetes bacterium]|jgi:phosphate transport system substrate-binding protein|nr:substrate-binding domain-containing protein [Bacteroidota bacterium]
MKRVLLAMLVIVGCQRKPSVEEVSTTQGPLTLIAAPDVAALADTLAQEFARIYPGIRPVTGSAPARQAIVALLNDSVSTIVVDRPMNEEEKKVAADAGITIASSLLAWDALVVVVHTDRRLDGITREGLGRIVDGTDARWSDVAKGERPEPIEFVCTERNSGLYEHVQRGLGEGRTLKVFATGTTQKELVQYVGRSPRALAIVSLGALRDRPPTIRTVPVRTVVDSSSGRTEFVAPHQQSVFDGVYPLRTAVMIYNAERRLGPGAGFAAFALSNSGQKLVQQSGIVPTELPSRTVQLTGE